MNHFDYYDLRNKGSFVEYNKVIKYGQIQRAL